MKETQALSPETKTTQENKNTVNPIAPAPSIKRTLPPTPIENSNIMPAALAPSVNNNTNANNPDKAVKSYTTNKLKKLIGSTFDIKTTSPSLIVDEALTTTGSSISIKFKVPNEKIDLIKTKFSDLLGEKSISNANYNSITVTFESSELGKVIEKLKNNSTAKKVKPEEKVEAKPEPKNAALTTKTKSIPAEDDAWLKLTDSAPTIENTQTTSTTSTTTTTTTMNLNNNKNNDDAEHHSENEQDMESSSEDETIKTNKTIISNLLENDSFKKLTLENLDLSYQVIKNKTFHNVNFKNINMDHIVMSGCTFVNCIFLDCNIADGNFENTTLEFVTIDKFGEDDDITLNNLNLANAKIMDSEIRNNNMISINLTSTQISNSSIFNCTMTKAKLDNTEIVNTTIIDCDLNNVDLSCCSKLEKVSMIDYTATHPIRHPAPVSQKKSSGGISGDFYDGWDPTDVYGSSVEKETDTNLSNAIINPIHIEKLSLSYTQLKQVKANTNSQTLKDLYVQLLLGQINADSVFCNFPKDLIILLAHQLILLYRNDAQIKPNGEQYLITVLNNTYMAVMSDTFWKQINLNAGEKKILKQIRNALFSPVCDQAILEKLNEVSQAVIKQPAPASIILFNLCNAILKKTPERFLNLYNQYIPIEDKIQIKIECAANKGIYSNTIQSVALKFDEFAITEYSKFGNETNNVKNKCLEIFFNSEDAREDFMSFLREKNFLSTDNLVLKSNDGLSIALLGTSKISSFLSTVCKFTDKEVTEVFNKFSDIECRQNRDNCTIS